VRPGSIKIVLAAALFGAALAAGCSSPPGLRVRGADAATERPALAPIPPRFHPFRVWVLVPRIRVGVYPMRGERQQPMLQFTGDRARLDRGWGQMAMLAAPDEFHDGEVITYFDDKVLWTESLAENDDRVFSLWLRENNKTAPTHDDMVVARFGRAAGALDEIAGLAGVKIAAERAVNVSHDLLKQFEKDWLIVRWTCPWSHVLAAAKERTTPERPDVVLKAEVVSAEKVAGQPTADLTVLFVVKRLDRPEVAGIAEAPSR
jgi:hypothetical protein